MVSWRASAVEWILHRSWRSGCEIVTSQRFGSRKIPCSLIEADRTRLAVVGFVLVAEVQHRS